MYFEVLEEKTENILLKHLLLLHGLCFTEKIQIVYSIYRPIHYNLMKYYQRNHDIVFISLCIMNVLYLFDIGSYLLFDLET